MRLRRIEPRHARAEHRSRRRVDSSPIRRLISALHFPRGAGARDPLSRFRPRPRQRTTGPAEPGRDGPRRLPRTILLSSRAQRLTALDIGDLGSRIYPNGQGQRAPARPAFGFAADDNAALPAAPEQPCAGFGGFGGAFMRLKVTPLGVVRPAHRDEPFFLEGGPGMTGRGVPQPSVGSLKPRFPGSPPQPAASTKQVLGPRPLQGMGRSPGESRCAHCGASATGQEARRLIVTGRCSPARVHREVSLFVGSATEVGACFER